MKTIHDYLRKCGYCSLLSVALLTFFSLPLHAQQYSDDELLDVGISAYEQNNYVEATMYLFAWQERGTRSDPDYVKKVRLAFEYSRDEAIRAQEDSRGHEGRSASGLRKQPPPLQRPTVERKSVGIGGMSKDRQTVEQWHLTDQLKCWQKYCANGQEKKRAYCLQKTQDRYQKELRRLK